MNRTILSVTVLSLATAFATEFPYEAEMTVRHEKASAEVASFESPVEIPEVNGGMPLTDSVATLYAGNVVFCAANERVWTAGTNAVGSARAQASLTMKEADGVCRWMCCTAGRWVELTGLAAEEGEWQVKVEIDYSLGAGNERVRYSVGKSVEELTPLNYGGQVWLALGNAGSTSGEQKINFVRLYGMGETGLVQAMSGRRSASGTITVDKDFGKRYQDLKLAVSVADPWGVDSVEVELKDAAGNSLGTQSVPLVDGTAKVSFSGLTPCDTYTYELSLKGNRRGADISYTDEPKEVLVGVEADWFAFENGQFVNASAGPGLTVSSVLSAAAVSPRGLVVPTSAAPMGTKIVTLESTMTVAGAVQEAALSGLDATGTQGALTVVRWSDGNRTWACRQADGSWRRLLGTGVSAANGTYEVKAVADYRNGTAGVSYSVKTTDGWTILANANDETQTRFDLPAGAAVMTKASLLGGSVSCLNAVTRSAPVSAGLMLIFSAAK